MTTSEPAADDRACDTACADGPESERTESAPREVVLRLSLRLVTFTLAYNLVEGAVAIAAGEVAGSTALLGFGLDSAIECAAAAVAIWRLRVELRLGSPESIETAERRLRQVVGVSFAALAVWVTGQSTWGLVQGKAPDASTVGIALAAASLVVMPVLTWVKLRAARRLGSSALRGEAMQTLACSVLSVPLLLGLVANAWLGWWWADAAAALCMVPWLIREARTGLRGEDCC